MASSFVFFFAIALISFVAISEIRRKNKRIEKLEKDWRFCKKLLDQARQKHNTQQ